MRVIALDRGTSQYQRSNTLQSQWWQVSVDKTLATHWFFLGPRSCAFRNGTLLASLPRAWHYKMRSRTGWPGVSKLSLHEIACLMWNSCGNSYTIVRADQSQRWPLHSAEALSKQRNDNKKLTRYFTECGFILVCMQLCQVSEEVPTEIHKAISTAQSVRDEIARLGQERENLRHAVLDHAHDVKPMMQQLGDLTQQLQELEKHSKYLAFVARVEELR